MHTHGINPMSTHPRFLPSLIFIGLLVCGTAILAQEPVEPVRPAAAEYEGTDAAGATEFAHEESQLDRPRASFVGWMIRSMGVIGLFILMAGLFSFVLTLVIAIRGQGPFAIAALVFLVPIPLLLSLFGTVQGMIMSLQVIATSSIAPKPSEISDGIATALFSPMLGLVAMTPSYLVATLAAIFRSFATPVVKP